MFKPDVTRGPFAVTLVAVTVAAVAALLPAGSARADVAGSAGPTAATTGPSEVITVTAASYGTTYATFRAYRVSAGRRIEVFGPWTARVGYNGVARPGKKREGDGTTPSGTYGFGFFFGVNSEPDPHFAFPFRHAYTYDYWDDDSKSPRYNEWVGNKAQAGADPEPMHNVPAYDYAAVIAYNTARVRGLGSAIFLHVGTGGSTAGCVSLPKAELLKVLGWLKPADSPRITITG